MKRALVGDEGSVCCGDGLAEWRFLVSNQHAAWTLVALGVWLFVAPWALGFTASVTAFWAHIAASLGLAALAAAIVWRSGQGDTTVAA